MDTCSTDDSVRTGIAEGPDQQARDQDRGIIVNANDMTEDMLPKKKRKNKSKRIGGQRGLNKSTGFEDNFADAPFTPDQRAELKELYSFDLPFVERILRAIHRFERTRKLSNERRDIFFKYLSYGGFDTGPNMFQGHQDVIEEMDKNEAITAKGQAGLSEVMKNSIHDPKANAVQRHHSGHRKSDEGQTRGVINPSCFDKLSKQYKYVIDFYGTMCAFLSRRAIACFGLDSKEMVDLITSTLERFMDYLLQHEVSPEYADEILQTRNLCRDARLELKSCVEVQHWLPGDFNIACSTLSGGSYGSNYDGSTYWGDGQADGNVFVGLTQEKASQIVGFAMAAAADEEIYNKYANAVADGASFHTVKTITGHGFEIVDIERATKECCDVYRANTDEYRPAGKIHAKFWRNPDSPPEDLTKEERATLQSASVDVCVDALSRLRLFDGTITFFLEDSNILPHLRVGQKIECDMHQLNFGMWFFDEVIRIYPSFDTWIENELTFDWKGPKPLEGAIYPYDSNATADEEEEDVM